MNKTIKNMRKLVAISSCVLMLGALTLTGCKKNNEDAQKTTDSQLSGGSDASKPTPIGGASGSQNASDVNPTPAISTGGNTENLDGSSTIKDENKKDDDKKKVEDKKKKEEDKKKGAKNDKANEKKADDLKKAKTDAEKTSKDIANALGDAKNKAKQAS